MKPRLRNECGDAPRLPAREEGGIQLHPLVSRAQVFGCAATIVAGLTCSCGADVSQAGRPLADAALADDKRCREGAGHVARVPAECGLRFIDVCSGPSDEGHVSLCGDGHWPDINDRFVLFGARRPIVVEGSLVVVDSVTPQAGGVEFRTSGKLLGAPEKIDYTPIGAIGPWTSDMRIDGGKFTWGSETEYSFDSWQTFSLLSLPGVRALEVQHRLATCELLMRRTVFEDGGLRCVTETNKGQPEGAIKFPSRCTEPGLAETDRSTAVKAP
ncbi:hypothetical protein [Polyangium sorediatum]|uniref:Lipoprotein n=1 Tax=Polyangium sorediatum TaxID=889274 RepID=A0ABT6PAS4_9BACT|nr:hypothetical protein [Polyangium sorediatum]MDI1437707.1 hypothetical protein [Polyangium sorediatum]